MDEGRERIPSGGDLSGLARDFLARIGQIGEDPGQLVPLAESAIEEGPQDPDRRIEQRGGPSVLDEIGVAGARQDQKRMRRSRASVELA